MTAHAMEAARQMCLDAGMNDRLTKPVDPKSLIRTLARRIDVVSDKAIPTPLS